MYSSHLKVPGHVFNAPSAPKPEILKMWHVNIVRLNH